MDKKGKGNIYNIKQHFVFPGNNGVLQFGGTKIERVPPTMRHYVQVLQDG